jgi:phosphate acetyltransferase
MSSFIDGIVTKAKQGYKTIVLPEGEDERVLTAAHRIAEEKIAKIILLGVEDDIKAFYKAKGWAFDGIEIINPLTSPKLQQYADLFYELRKEKGVTPDAAFKTAQNANYFGTLMMKSGDADGMVSGAAHSTADTVRPALQIIKSSRKDMGVSSFFFMNKDEKTFIFADCAITPNPTDQELANIAMQAALTAVQFGLKPNIAMLSYSTYGSAKGEMVEKVQRATKIAKEMAVSDEFKPLGIDLDGEMQVDAALVDKVAALKAPGSSVAGHADILIFPDLNAGNIAYKLVQRLGGYEAFGPVLQGLKAPINDLSRGCSAEDIVYTVALTAVQAM